MPNYSKFLDENNMVIIIEHKRSKENKKTQKYTLPLGESARIMN